MKKNIKLIIVAILAFCLIVTICILKITNKKQILRECNNLNLEQIVSEINLATNSNFLNYEDKDDMTMYMPVSLLGSTNYVFCHGDDLSSDYFLVVEKISDEELFELEKYIDINNDLYDDKKIELGIFGDYTYAIFSNEYSSVIEGILRSYVYCK